MSDLQHADVIKRFELEGSGPWVTLYYYARADGEGSECHSCALAPVSYRADALRDPGWDLSIGDHHPGFSQIHENGREVNVYERCASSGVEPLVIMRNFHGVRPSYPELSEEFRLFHSLYWDAAGSCFLKFADDGTEEVAIEIAADRIRAKTKLIRQYQAARQMDFLVFVDSYHYGKKEGEPLPDERAWESDTIKAALYPNTFTSPPGSRYLATRVFPPPAIERCGVWPFEEEDTHYPEFIIGTDGDGRDVSFSCDHERLANYFGANPEAPHYLTPVDFRRDVLKKYYDKPELYSIEDGYLRCGGLWGLRMDNDHVDRVVVFLGDLGRDLPRAERDYWRSFNVAPDGPMSETGIRRAFLGQFADPQSVDLRFRSRYSEFLNEWPRLIGWPLFRGQVGPDKHLLQQVRLPLDDSDNELLDVVSSLAKLLCDSIDSASLLAHLPSRVEGERSIAKLDRWLKQEAYPFADRDVKLLRDIQELRSTNAAHAKGSGYNEIRRRILGSVPAHEGISRLLSAAVLMLDDLEGWAKERRA